jgi:hypothetical protein
MADYFTHFSCVLDVGTLDNAVRALDLFPAFMKEAAREGALAGGFQVSIHPDQGGTKLWMRDEVTGDPLQVIIFVQRCAEVFSLTGRWGFQWANTCSQHGSMHSAAAHTYSICRPADRLRGFAQTAGWLAQSGQTAEREVCHEHS